MKYNVTMYKTNERGLHVDTIVLSGKKELDIYINPQRQNLLRCMRIAGVPMTPKQIADRIGISPSSVQHHIRKLVELGIVELSHTELIRGITAKYYHVLPKTVSIGLMVEDETREDRFVLMQNALSTVFSSFAEYCRKAPANITDEGEQHGDMLSGIINLEREEAKELYGVIRSFLAAHEHKGKAGTAWEYALIAYPVAEAEDA